MKKKNGFFITKHILRHFKRQWSALRERQVYTSKNYEAKWIGRNQ